MALLDIDPQHSLTQWHALRPTSAAKLTFSDVSGWRVTGELDRLKAANDIVLIDSPPQIDTDARLAIRGANLVLIPVQPSPPDIWAAEGTLKLAAAEKRKAAMVLNRMPATGKLRETITAQLQARPQAAADRDHRQSHRLCRRLSPKVWASPRPPLDQSRRMSYVRC